MSVPSNNAVELKGGLYTFMSLRLGTAEPVAVDTALADKVQQAPAFFRNIPVVVDLADLDEEVAIDGPALLECIRRHRLHPIVASLADKSSPLAESIALPLVEAGAKRRDKTAEPAAGAADARNGGMGGGTDGGGVDGTDDAAGASARDAGAGGGAGPAAEEGGRGTGTGGPPDRPGAEPAAALAAPREVEYVVRTPLLVDRPVRSGQQLYARDTDLIIMGQVGPGAEVIADNNIHVYGPLRGRALCGVSGNTDTRIFCQSLEAELVSVAGVYRMLETIPEELRGKPAQIWLDNDRLNIEPL